MTDARDELPVDDPTTRSRMDRLRAEQARAVRGIERTRTRLEAARPNSRALDAAFRAFERDIAAGGGVLAGAVAFRIFLFLVPYTFVLVCVFGVGASAANQAPGSLARDAGIGGLAAKAMGSVGDLSTTERIVSLAVAGFALLLATRALLKVLRIVHALIWHTRAGKAEKPARAAGMLIGVVTLAMGVAVLVGKLRGESVLLGLVATLLYVAVPFTVWLLVSWYMPRPADLPWTALLPGAVFFGVGIEVLHVVTVYWIAREVESKTDTYGALGFALALLLWAYLLGRVVTSATVINESLWSRYQERRRPRPDPGSPGPRP
jgi:membrane protein